MPIARSGKQLYAVVLPAVSILACIATGGGFVVAIPRIVSRMVRMLNPLEFLRFSSARLG